MIKLAGFMSSVAILLLLSGCMAPHLKIPNHKLPDRFKFQGSLTKDEPLVQWWQAADDENLTKLITIALAHNYDVRIAVESVQYTRARYQLSAAQLWPQLGIIAEAFENQVSSSLVQNTFYPKKKFSLFGLGYDVSWEIDLWGKLFLQRRTQKYLYQAEIENLRGIFITLIADVARLYTELCSFHQQLRCAQELKKIQKEKTLLTHDMLQAGLASLPDYELQVQQEMNARELVISLDESSQQTGVALLALLGLEPDASLPVEPGPIPLTTIVPTVGLPSELLRRRPDIRAAERTLAAQNASIGSACAQWFPSFTLFGAMQTQANSIYPWFESGSLSWIFGPYISWPLINFGRVKAQIREAEAQTRKAALFYSQVIINAFKDLENACIAYRAARTQEEIAKKRFCAAHTAYTRIRSMYESGLASNMDRLDAAFNCASQERLLIIQQHKIAYSIIAIYKALGGGW